MSEKRGRQKGRSVKGIGMLIILLLILLFVVAGGYWVMTRYYQTHFFNGATINGVAVGGKTEREARYAIQNKIRSYTLTCLERGGIEEEITGDEIYMEYVDDKAVEQALESQNSALWLFQMGKSKKHTANIQYTFDEDAIDSVMHEMDGFKEQNVAAPVAARIDLKDDAYVVIPGDEGNTLDREKTRAALIAAIKQGKREIDFDKEGLYIALEDHQNTEELQKTADSLNQMLNSNITYDFVDRKYTVDKDTVRSFIQKNAEGNYALNRDQVRSFVNQMALETDTYARPHTFKTSTGRTITLNEGFDDRFVPDYGWAMKVDATTDDLITAIGEGKEGNLEPSYAFKAQDRSSNDIGNTYVEICIEKQEMWCYKDGNLIVDTPIVTGNHARGQDTPSGGVYAIDAKQSDRNFEKAHNVHVNYWLPFIASCGIHDAYWRTDYDYSNKNTWKANGSNGCINTPLDAARKIYEVMDIGYPVVVYYSEDQVKGTDPPNNVGY